MVRLAGGCTVASAAGVQVGFGPDGRVAPGIWSLAARVSNEDYSDVPLLYICGGAQN